MKRVRREFRPQPPYTMFQDLVVRFQAASESLEHSYAELQEKVVTLSAELQKEREERIRLERLAGMGEMAMELAHEIRNPLGSIELYASMLEGEYAEQIVRSVRLLNHTVTNILQFGKPIYPVARKMSVAELFAGLRAMIGPLADQKSIHIETVCPPQYSAVADFELLHRMLLNLGLNALRETPSGGTIRFCAATEEHDTVFTVVDTGMGIPAETKARIFDPMFSTHREGCGLGLSIVKRIVESHSGTIDLTSSPKGTTFTIRIPVNSSDMEVASELIACCG